jgi:hypothetical protein
MARNQHAAQLVGAWRDPCARAEWIEDTQRSEARRCTSTGHRTGRDTP